MRNHSVSWNPFDPLDRGPRIRFSVSRFIDDNEAGERLGLEYASAPIPTALIDTGSPFTIISKVLARTCGLPLHLADPTFQIMTMGGPCNCEVYVGRMSFPGTRLPTIDALRILAREFYGEEAYSAIIGRNVLKLWNTCFNGTDRLVTITTPDVA
jgi:predicted aspartyl protease